MQRCIFLLHISKTTKPREFLKIIFYYLLAEGPGVARGKNRFFSPCHPSSGYPLVSSKNLGPFGPAVWSAIGNIHTNVII